MYADTVELRQRLGRKIFNEIYLCTDADVPVTAESDLAAAAAEVDGSLASRYTLPVTTPRSLALLKDWTLTLAEERAYARAAGSNYAEKVKGRVEQVRKYLEKIQQDLFKLPDAAEKRDSSSRIAVRHGESAVFGRNNMKDF